MNIENYIPNAIIPECTISDHGTNIQMGTTDGRENITKININILKLTKLVSIIHSPI